MFVLTKCIKTYTDRTLTFNKSEANVDSVFSKAYKNTKYFLLLNLRLKVLLKRHQHDNVTNNRKTTN